MSYLCRTSVRSSLTNVHSIRMDKLVYSEVPEYATNTMAGLDRMRRDSPDLCDFALCVEGKTFPCHRSILCLHSEYFRGMITGKFLEEGTNFTTFTGIAASSLETILDFIYTGRVEIDQTSVEGIFEVASRLQFQKIIDICARYLCHQIDETNSIDLYKFGKAQAIPELADAAKQFTYQRLDSVFEVDDVIKDMTSNQVEEIVKDDLAHMHGEERIIMSILKWIAFDQPKRLKEIERLMQNIDWSRVSTKFILRTLLYHPTVATNRVAKELIVGKVRKVLDNVPLLDESLPALSHHNTQDNGVVSLHWHRSSRTQVQDHMLGGEKEGCLQEALLLIGGLTLGEAERGDTSQPNVMCYVPRTNTWEERTAWPERRLRGFSVTNLNNDVYVTGGCNFTEMRRNNIRKAWIYHVEKDSWQRLSDMSRARSFHSSCQSNGELFVVGGAYNDKIDIEVHNPHSSQWTALKQYAPKYVWNFAAAACNGKIVLIGSGANSSTLLLQCYNPSVEQWSQFRSPNVPRHLSAPLCATSNDGSLIFLTGDNSQKMFLFDANTNKWTRKGDMQHLHANGGMTTLGGSVYLTGGHWEDDGYWDQMESFDIQSGKWTSRGPLPHLWLYHSCTAVMVTS